MPPVTINHCALVAVHGQHQGHPVTNVFCYLKTTGAPTPTDIDDLATFWGNTGWSAMRQVLSSTYQLIDIAVKDVNVAYGYEKIIYPTGTQVGARGGDSQASNVAAEVNWHSTQAGRSGSGRTFFGPVSETDGTADIIGTSLMTALQVFISFLIANNPTGGWTFAVGSRKLHVGYNVIGAVLDSYFDSQRRRLIRPGH